MSDPLEQITTSLAKDVQGLQRQAAEPDPEDEAFLTKLQAQRSVMAAADFKAATRAVRQMQRSSELLLCRRIAEAISEAMSALNVPLTPGVPKRRRQRAKPAAGPQPEQQASPSETNDLQSGDASTSREGPASTPSEAKPRGGFLRRAN